MADPEVLHDFNPIGLADEEATGFKPVGESGDNLNPTQKVKPDVGSLESFGRGAANAFALGYSPQLIAAIKSGNMPGSDNSEYLNELAKQKSYNEEAWNQHPWLYGSGMAAAAIPAAVNAVVAGPEEAAAAGGAGLLAESGNIGSLAGAGLRSLTGGTGLAGKAAGVLENPLAQGAIYGSSEGDTLGDKASGAIAGAAGAKVAPMILGAAAKGIGSLAGKIADPVVHALTGGADSAAIAGNLAHDIGVSLPSAATGLSTPVSVASKLDFFNQIPKASARTLSELGSKVSDIAGDADPEKAGEAVRSAVGKWLKDEDDPMGFRSQMNNHYAPLSDLSNSNQMMDISNVRAAVDAARNSSLGKISDIEPTLNVVAKALADKSGHNFENMKDLRGIISDAMTFNRLPGSAGLNDSILGQLRDAATKDMNAYAQSVGGTQAVQDLANANANAQKLYNLRDNILKTVGNPNQGDGFKAPSSIYSNIISSASAKKPNIAALSPLQQVVNNYDPDAWSLVGKTYANTLAPGGQFSFGHFNKFYNDALHPTGKDLLFGSGAARDAFDKIDALGRVTSDGVPLGSKLDTFAQKAGANIAPVTVAEPIAAITESALLGGLPLKTMGAAGMGSLAGAYGARNISRPISQYTPTTGQKIIGKAIQKSAPLVGAQAINPLGAGAIKAAVPYGVMKATEQLPSWLYDSGQHAAGGRIGRKTGGVVRKDAKAEAHRLIALSEKIRKKQAQQTEPLLNLDDTTVAKALEIANRGI